jgi:hypothetical protein
MNFQMMRDNQGQRRSADISGNKEYDESGKEREFATHRMKGRAL